MTASRKTASAIGRKVSAAKKARRLHNGRARAAKAKTRVRSKVEPAHLPSLLTREEFIPQAIVNKPVERFASPNTHIFADADDLDEYEGIGFYLGGTPFAVMHYKGHPASTSTIYLPHSMSDEKKISSLLRQILAHFKIRSGDIVWHRKDSPSL
jgi:hypothetical protein